MISAHHGNRAGLRELRARFPVSQQGASLSWIIAVADQLGLQSRPLRLDLDDLGKLATPCILHWNLNHFVVLAKVRGERVTILDPASGKRLLRLADLSNHFTGVALELAQTTAFVPVKAPPRVRIGQLTGRMPGLARTLGLILALSLALQVFVLLAPFFMQWVVDHALVAGDRELLTVLGLGFGLALLLQVGIGALRGWVVVFLSNRLSVQWGCNVFAHVLRLPLDFFQKRHLGDVTSRLESVQAIQRTLTTSFVEAVMDGLLAVVTLGMMLLYSPGLALASIAAVGLYLALRALSYRPFREGAERHLISAARQESHLLESIRGIQSVKVTGCEIVRRSTYFNLFQETANREAHLGKLEVGFASASNLVFGLERVAVIWMGAALALNGAFSVGMLVAYLAYKDQFSVRVGGLVDKWIEFRMLRLHGERLADIALAAPERDNDASGHQRTLMRARLEVSGVGFRYAENEPWVLNGCSFTVEDGESLAIVGASGCGKTTLVKLLLGLLPPSEGSIRVDACELREFGAWHYRQLVGAVMQEDQLFAGSIGENIALGEETVDWSRVEEAAQLAAIHSDIAAMPMRYHTLIGDMGTTLSGGQKQRVILARALYRKPRFLFLDEATSHLDVQSEHVVNMAVRALNLTRIIIAHRQETIASADRVLVLHGGRIVQEVRPGQSVA